LKHPFSPPQYKFAKLIHKAKGRCIGLVGITGKIHNSHSYALMIPPEDLKAGNFSWSDLHSKFNKIYRIKDGLWQIDKLIEYMEKIRRK